MKNLISFYKKHLSWRPSYYKKSWKAYKYLENYKEYLQNKHNDYQFRGGMNFSFNEKESANHVFSEIFIGECYPINESTKQEKVIIDIGANIGFFTIYALIKNPNSQILAVEANPKNFEILKNNIYENSLSDNVRVFNYVVTSEPGLQPFYLSSNSGWSSIYNERGAKNGKIIHVDSTSLSRLLENNKLNVIDLLKIDIEGAEYDIMLKDKFLENFIVKELFIEVDKRPRDKRYEYHDIINFLSNHYKSIKVVGHESEYPLIICKDYINM